MEEKIPCACCGRAVGMDTFPACGYCGYLNVAVVGGTTRYDSAAREHRTAAIAKLTDISVTAYQYGWSEEEGRYGLLSTERIKLADGPDCDGAVFWAGQSFEQNPDGGPVPLKLTYRYGGQWWSVQWEARPKPSRSCWDIGLEIDGGLSLVIYLGGPQSWVKCEPIAFIQRKGGAPG